MIDKRARPYWHVDVKWIFGIFFALCLWIALWFYTLSSLTAEKTAIPLATQIVAGQFSPKGLDDPTDIKKFKQESEKTPGDVVHPLPNTTVTKSELNTLSPRQLRLKIFEQVVRPYYELGAEGVAAKQTADPAQRDSIMRQAGLLAYFNKKTNESFRKLFLISMGVSLVPLAGLVFFSYGLGRLVSPGIVAVGVALPGALASLAAFVASKSPSENPGDAGPLSFLSPEAAGQVTLAILPGYIGVFSLGLILLLGSFVGVIVRRYSRRSAKNRAN